MSKIVIGKSGKHNAGFDIDELLITRLLITANSGGGKSFLVRRVLEQAFGKVQCFVIDVAGEFASLREKYGYVLVGEHGETPVDLRSAGLVAEKLLELRASAVFDLYSLKPPVDRHTWVKHFLAAMMNAPKKLWHPVLVVVDEAHKFMPEKGEGESEAKTEMLSLCSDGRKYGYCAILPTQRLAKLDKSGASELLNVMVGPTFIDVDLERAHKALGIVRSDFAAFDEQMKTIAPGNFWALGRAISKKRILIKVGDVATTHPKPGMAHSAEPPPAPDKIRALLPKLADLPQAAEQKARTEAEYKREIRELRTQLKTVKPAPAPVQAKADPHQARTIQQLRTALEEAKRLMTKVANLEVQPIALDQQQIEAAVRDAVQRIVRLTSNASVQQQRQFEQLKREAKPMLDKLQRLLDAPAAAVAPAAVPATSTAAVSRPAPLQIPRAPVANGEGVSLGKLSKQIAGILAGFYPDPMKRNVVAALCGMSIGGSFSARLSELRGNGLLEEPGVGLIKATEQCSREFAGTFDRPSTTDEVLALWDSKLGRLAMQILRKLVEASGEAIERSDLAASVGMSIGGSFSARLSELRSAGLISEPTRSLVAANKETLLLDGAAA